MDLQGRERPVPGFQTLVGGAVKIDQVLDHGDIIDLGQGLNLEVIHTPGHSPGSVSLWIEADKALFSGDAVPIPGDMPIYVDSAASVTSIKKLMEQADIEVLLSSWDEPRQGDEVVNVMDNGLRYLQKIEEEVLQEAGNKDPDLTALTAKVVEKIGLLPFAANPLVALSFASQLKKETGQD